MIGFHFDNFTNLTKSINISLLTQGKVWKGKSKATPSTVKQNTRKSTNSQLLHLPHYLITKWRQNATTVVKYDLPSIAFILSDSKFNSCYEQHSWLGEFKYFINQLMFCRLNCPVENWKSGNKIKRSHRSNMYLAVVARSVLGSERQSVNQYWKVINKER